MAPPGLFSEAGYSGIGFSIGCGVNINVAKTRLPGTLGEFFWGGAASTAFWIDPKEELAVVFMTQVIVQRRPADAPPRSAHTGLLGDDGVVRVVVEAILRARGVRLDVVADPDAPVGAMSRPADRGIC